MENITTPGSTRYSDIELEDFRQLIQNKLDIARDEFNAAECRTQWLSMEAKLRQN